MSLRDERGAMVKHRTTTLATSPPERLWMLVERYVKHYPTGWQLVFRRGDEVLEVSVDEEVWRAFDS